MVPNCISVQLSSFKILLAELLQLFHLDLVESRAPCSSQALDNLVQLFSRIGYKAVVVVGHCDDFQVINYLTFATIPSFFQRIRVKSRDYQVHC